MGPKWPLDRPRWVTRPRTLQRVHSMTVLGIVLANAGNVGPHRAPLVRCWAPTRRGYDKHCQPRELSRKSTVSGHPPTIPLNKPIHLHFGTRCSAFLGPNNSPRSILKIQLWAHSPFSGGNLFLAPTRQQTSYAQISPAMPPHLGDWPWFSAEGGEFPPALLSPDIRGTWADCVPSRLRWGAARKRETGQRRSRRVCLTRGVFDRAFARWSGQLPFGTAVLLQWHKIDVRFWTFLGAKPLALTARSFGLAMSRKLGLVTNPFFLMDLVRHAFSGTRCRAKGRAGQNPYVIAFAFGARSG